MSNVRDRAKEAEQDTAAFGQDAMDRAAATAAMDKSEKQPSLRRVALDPNAPRKARRNKAQARLDKIKASTQTSAPAAPKAETMPTYGGMPGRLDEFHATDEELATRAYHEKVGTPLGDNPDSAEMKEKAKRTPKPELAPAKAYDGHSFSDLALASATDEMDRREGKATPNAVTQGELTEASDAAATVSGRIADKKAKGEVGKKNPKSPQNPGMPSYVWDSKADKFGTRGKRGKVTHVSDEQDDLIRAELTRKADQPKLGKGEVGRDGNKFKPSTTDWQGTTPTRAEVEEGARTRAQYGPRTGAGEVTGDRIVNEGGPKAGKRFRQAQAQQDQYDRFKDTEAGYVDNEDPKVLEKQAQLLGKDINDPDYKAPGKLTEHRARARIVVHGGVKEDVVKNIKGQALLDLHDTVMDKKNFEETRVGTGKEDVFSHKSGHIQPGDLMETGNKLNGVNEERPVPIGQEFKRSKVELGKGAGELVTSNAPGSDYTAGEVRPLSGFEGHSRERRMNADGSFRHVWVENKLPENIQHASDRIVESVNKFGGFKPKKADKQRRKDRAEADKQNAAAGEVEEYGLDKRTRNRNAAPVGENVVASAQNQAEMRTRAAWATGDVEDARDISEAQPTTSDSILSRAVHAKKAKKLAKVMASANVHLGQPPKASDGEVREEKLETIPGATPQPANGERFEAAVANAPAAVRKSKQFSGTSDRARRVSLRTVETPVAEGGLGGSVTGVNVTGAQEIQDGPVDRSRGDKNPFGKRLGDFDTVVVPGSSTRGAPVLSQQMQRHQAQAALASAPAAPAAPRSIVKASRPLTSKESAAVEDTKADDSRALVTRGGGGRGKAPVKLYNQGDRVIHKEHGAGSVYGQDTKTGKLALRLDKDPDTVMDDVPHSHVTQEGRQEIAIPSRGKRASQAISETAEPSGGQPNLKSDSTSPLHKLLGLE